MSAALLRTCAGTAAAASLLDRQLALSCPFGLRAYASQVPAGYEARRREPPRSLKLLRHADGAVPHMQREPGGMQRLRWSHASAARPAPPRRHEGSPTAACSRPSLPLPEAASAPQAERCLLCREVGQQG
ncbi:hypothetical protein FA09DRAFT_181471 [Tilletiopsis washingtonensis]|uniref:Uncharacterized protein n=1 Tax=Tilletiopsis washingtonensis TaxID=58919 RepID=A0A316ZIY3_9BASI|nr:hypothetical protein FA09DRAFT_181471 [Tilletiopsis washingtonensis]PWO00296.1 hypothetical protein FA09DRAFT_181471 [Tilletiopsis washingtonensis]